MAYGTTKITAIKCLNRHVEPNNRSTRYTDILHFPVFKGWFYLVFVSFSSVTNEDNLENLIYIIDLS